MESLRGRRLTAAGAAFEIAEWQNPGGVTSAERPIAAPHVHHADDESWYVLEGRLGFQIGDEQLEADAGCAVWAGRGVLHSYWNAGPGPARYLLITTPKIFALVDALHQAGAVDYGALFRQYDSELL